jgi:hypothetical protein
VTVGCADAAGSVAGRVRPSSPAAKVPAAYAQDERLGGGPRRKRRRLDARDVQIAHEREGRSPHAHPERKSRHAPTDRSSRHAQTDRSSRHA